MPHLPPLAALRAFEAAARHLSFTRAADELHVTQTAISHQIRGLEERLGVRLFRRLSRGLVLTDEAQRYLPAVRDAFTRLEAATAELLARRTGGTLTASPLPLMPDDRAASEGSVPEPAPPSSTSDVAAGSVPTPVHGIPAIRGSASGPLS